MGWGGDHARTPNRTRTPTQPGSYSPRPLRPPLSQRPAARAPSARRRRPPDQPSAVAPPRPALSGPAPPPVACGRANVEGDGKGHDRTWTAGVCARVGVSGLVPSSSPCDSVPLLLSSPNPLQLGCCGGREGAGLAGVQLLEGGRRWWW